MNKQDEALKQAIRNQNAIIDRIQSSPIIRFPMPQPVQITNEQHLSTHAGILKIVKGQ